MRHDRIARTLRLLALALMTIASVRWARAGAFDEELGTDDAKLADRVKLDVIARGSGNESGRGQVPYLRALGVPPKRVALVSFYVWDSGNTTNHTYVGFKTTKNVRASTMDTTANEIYDASIDTFKGTLAQYGMQLLTPKEYLDTEQKRQAYEAFDPKIGALGKFTNFFKKSNEDNWRFHGVPEGYRLIELPIVNDTKNRNFDLVGDGKLCTSLGHDLATALGVDAVAIVYNVVQAQNKGIDMLGSYLHVFGPNPVKRSDDPSLYWTGHQYGGVHMKLDVPFVKTDRKGNATEEDFAGYARVARALSTRAGEFLLAKCSGKEE